MNEHSTARIRNKDSKKGGQNHLERQMEKINWTDKLIKSTGESGEKGTPLSTVIERKST